MTDRLRLFVAVPLTDALRATLAESTAAWRLRGGADALRWTDPDAWHLTLAFLGATDANRLDEIRDALATVAGEGRPMRLRTGGLGGFPRLSYAGVLWYGVEDPDGDLAALANGVRRMLGVAEGSFRPHVTLARSRGRELDLRQFVEASEGELPVESVELVRSHLGRGGSRYETLRSFPLGVPSRV